MSLRDEREATTCSLDSTLVAITEYSAAWHSSLGSSRNDLKSALNTFTQLNPWHLHQEVGEEEEEEEEEGPDMVGWKTVMENVHGMNGRRWWLVVVVDGGGTYIQKLRMSDGMTLIYLLRPLLTESPLLLLLLQRCWCSSGMVEWSKFIRRLWWGDITNPSVQCVRLVTVNPRRGRILLLIRQ